MGDLLLIFSLPNQQSAKGMSWVLSYFIYFPVSRLSPPVISSEPSRVSASGALIDWTLSETDNLCVSISTCGLHSAAQYKVTALFFLPLLWLMSLECWEQHRLYSWSLPLWRAGAAWPVIICWRDSVLYILSHGISCADAQHMNPSIFDTTGII